MAVLQCCSPVLVANHCGAITEQHKALEAEAYTVYSMTCFDEIDLLFACSAQWKVHVRRPGVIALQNMHTSQHWLAIRDGKTIGNVS